MKKIGLTQRVGYVEDRDEQNDYLDQRWSKILLGADMVPVPIPNRISDVSSYIFEFGIEGIILTGGNDLIDVPEARNPAPERDELEHKLLDLSAANNIPLLGVCRGMQILVAHYGGTSQLVTGHVAVCHRLYLVNPGVIPLTDREKVNSFHDYAIPDSCQGSDLQSIALSDDGTIEAVAHVKFRQWGIMWHPERAPYDARDITILRRLFYDE